MSGRRVVNIEQQDEVLSAEFWEVFNSQLDCNLSEDLFSEMSLEGTTNQQAPGEIVNVPEQPIEEVLSFESNQQEISTAHEPAPDHIEPESEESAPGNRKNVCGYMLKSVVQAFYSPASRRLLEKQCRKQRIAYSQVINHYKEVLPKVLGISVLTSALTAKNDSQLPAKEVFRKFLRWFLKKRYMLALLKSGKMQDKLSYIEVKNRKLLYFQYELAQTLLSMNSINN